MPVKNWAATNTVNNCPVLALYSFGQQGIVIEFQQNALPNSWAISLQNIKDI
jgi:hypothetical protein